MNFKFERMRKKEVVIFYLLTRNLISRVFLQHFRVVATREGRRLQTFPSGKPSLNLHRKLLLYDVSWLLALSSENIYFSQYCFRSRMMV